MQAMRFSEIVAPHSGPISLWNQQSSLVMTGHSGSRAFRKHSVRYHYQDTRESHLPTKPHKPSENELRLLNYLGLSEDASIIVIIGVPPCYEIIMGSKRRGPMKPLQIPFSGPGSLLDDSLRVYLFCYPPHGTDRNGRQTQARNLKLFLGEIEANSRDIAEQKLLTQKAAEEAELRMRLEYSGMDMFEDRR